MVLIRYQTCTCSVLSRRPAGSSPDPLPAFSRFELWRSEESIRPDLMVWFEILPVIKWESHNQKTKAEWPGPYVMSFGQSSSTQPSRRIAACFPLCESWHASDRKQMKCAKTPTRNLSSVDASGKRNPHLACRVSELLCEPEGACFRKWKLHCCAHPAAKAGEH